MVSCLFCKRKKRLFDIYVIYGKTGCPIKDYIIKFLGPVEEHLHEDQGICQTCVFVLNNLLYIKNFMYESIRVTEDAFRIKQEFAFAYMFRLFRHNLRKVDYDKSKSDEDSSPDLLSLAKSPDNELLEVNLQGVDDDECDVQSTYSLLREGTPYADREVENMLTKRKRRRPGRRRARTAMSRADSQTSFHSEPARRRKRLSSYISDFSNSESSDDDGGISKLRFDKNGILLNKKTRSVSHIISKSDAAYAEYTECNYKCVDSCQLEFENLTLLTEHKIEEHKMLAKFWCNECYKTRFTSQEDLEKHNNLRHKIIMNCSLCSEEMQNQEELQKHLSEHWKHSVPCIYCDKYFLNGHSCESHIKDYHKGRKKRIKRRRPQTILDRIDKEGGSEAKINEEKGNISNDNFVKVLIQSISVQEEKQKEMGKPISNNVVHNIVNFEEDSSSCNCDEDDINPQKSPDPMCEIIKDVVTVSEEKAISSCTSEESITSTCEVEEEICVTALEESFVASVQEICFTYTDVENAKDTIEESEGVHSDSITIIENETNQALNSEFIVEDERYDVALINEYSHDHISEVCHEEIVIDNSEYHEEIDKNQSKMDTINNLNIENHGARIISEEAFEKMLQKYHREGKGVVDDMCYEEIVIDNSEEDNFDDNDSPSNQHIQSINTDEFKMNRNTDVAVKHVSAENTNALTKSTRKKLEKYHRKEKEDRTLDIKNEITSMVTDPNKPQLKIVLERLKIGNDFLNDLLVNLPNSSKPPSTSLVSNKNAKSMKSKRLKKVTASVKTPVHYRKMGKIFREKKYGVAKPKNSTNVENLLNDKMEIYDFKEEAGGSQRMKTAKSLINTKDSTFHKAKTKSSTSSSVSTERRTSEVQKRSFAPSYVSKTKAVENDSRENAEVKRDYHKGKIKRK